MKPKADDVKKKIRQQDDDFYGDQAPGGTMEDLEADDDVEERMADALGEDAIVDIHAGKYEFDEEVDQDEKAQAFTTDKRAKELIKKDKRKLASAK
jgi:hypothetical protein